MTTRLLEVYRGWSLHAALSPKGWVVARKGKGGPARLDGYGMWATTQACRRAIDRDCDREERVAAMPLAPELPLVKVPGVACDGPKMARSAARRAEQVKELQKKKQLEADINSDATASAMIGLLLSPTGGTVAEMADASGVSRGTVRSYLSGRLRQRYNFQSFRHGERDGEHVYVGLFNLRGNAQAAGSANARKLKEKREQSATLERRVNAKMGAARRRGDYTPMPQSKELGA